MRMYDIIMKKRNGYPLSQQEIHFFIDSFTKGETPDYQAAALLMAIFFENMSPEETAALTLEIAKSGDMIDLSPIPGIKVDKHSTGGVGDKTSLIIGPIVAACGVPVAKMSGRGLGHTGGTVDKMESIPGLRTSMEKDEFFEIVKTVGLAIIGQTGNIAPADKKLYSLRDVTATVDSLPLIASSIMSKKLAAGTNAVLLDVKTGSGAFMKTLEDSVALASAMVSIGQHNGRNTMALVTDMDTPLGFAIGNALEIIEVIEVLHGRGPEDLRAVALELAANMLLLAEKGTLEECRILAQATIANGTAFAKLRAMAVAQGGDPTVLDDPEAFEKAPIVTSIYAEHSGYITHMNTEACGIASVALGAGRVKMEDNIDHRTGIVLQHKVGDPVTKGEPLAILHAATQKQVQEATQLLEEAIQIADTPPAPTKPILARVTKENIEML